MNLIKEMPPAPLTKELWKEAARVFFEDDTEKALEIADAIDREYAQKIKDEATISGGTGEGQPVAGGTDKSVGQDSGGEEDQFKNLISNLVSVGKAVKPKEAVAE
jgi:hypothetical protein